jgi:uncharacterized spore protein YtfJ
VDNIQKTLQDARDAMSVKRVYGDPYEKDGVTVIPAAAVRGGGGGGGGPQGTGGGVGFGLTARPVGAYVIKDGAVRWEPAVDATLIALRGMLIPILGLLVFRSLVKSIFRKRR